MIYTELTAKAMKIAYHAHKEQVDKAGIPYIYHPIHVAEQMQNEYSCIVALLHDVVEDTDVTIEELEGQFPKEIVDAIKLLTHDPLVPYLDYVRNLADNPIAKEVKLADLSHNSDPERGKIGGVSLDEKGQKRLEKYHHAIAILRGQEA